jgi:hypothetical protein
VLRELLLALVTVLIAWMLYAPVNVATIVAAHTHSQN